MAFYAQPFDWKSSITFCDMICMKISQIIFAELEVNIFYSCLTFDSEDALN